MQITDLRILIVADDPLARAGLTALLTNQPSCTVVGQTSSESDFISELSIYRPDVLLWDMGWEAASNLDHVVDFEEIDQPIVALLPDFSSMTQLWSQGIRSFLSRDADPDKIVTSLWAAFQGLITIDPDFADILFPETQATSASLVEALTPRELEVLQLLAEGLPNKSVARRLDISEHTVKFHVNAIMSKLNAQSRTEAVVRATQLGLILL